MIDDLRKSAALMERMQVALPMRAFMCKEVRRALADNAKREYPTACHVTEIKYLGDEGGIACHLNFGFSDSEQEHIVSITHLRFDRGNPLAREIGAYCKHRIKRLKNLQRGKTQT